MEFQEQVWYYITAGKGSPVHLFSIPLLVCFPCSSSAGVSGGVVGWIQVPNPLAISTIWKLNPWSWVSVHPAGRGRPPLRQWEESKPVKLLLKVFPEATLCWTVLVFVVWLFGGVCCFVSNLFGMKIVHYSWFPDVPTILSLFLPLFPSRNIFVSWQSFLLGADQTGACEGLEIQNWGVFGTVSVVIFTCNCTGIIATTDVLV